MSVNGCKCMEWVDMAGMAGNECKSMEMPGNGWKWLGMAENVWKGWKWLELMEIDGMAGNGWKWLEIAENGGYKACVFLIC